ncbi:helix-turn-helix transcriptional regulator [Plesiomonas shigelloides]|uniref:helix-turn-helix transcriptional regulator n=1 Tax=Plesiomonas shigelloides TaxID=703 RepID=UPI0022476E55|nr:helix-turn-helix domain-containing protein [Plesiomonas shigelloides]MCX2499321.1 helix-turn-helix domain-containing protein [Plesiomonas shigelloides]
MLINVTQAAKIMGVSRSTVERLRRRPAANFPAPIRVSDNCVRYDQEALLAWVKSRQLAAV